MAPLFYKMMTKIVRSLDPKLERFRPPKRSVPYVPKNRRDFEGVLNRSSDAIISEQQKYIVAALLRLDKIRAKDLMLPKSKLALLKEDEKLSMFTAESLNIGIAVGINPTDAFRVRLTYSLIFSAIAAAGYLVIGFFI